MQSIFGLKYNMQPHGADFGTDNVYQHTVITIKLYNGKLLE